MTRRCAVPCTHLVHALLPGKAAAVAHQLLRCPLMLPCLPFHRPKPRASPPTTACQHCWWQPSGRAWQLHSIWSHTPVGAQTRFGKICCTSCAAQRWLPPPRSCGLGPQGAAASRSSLFTTPITSRLPTGPRCWRRAGSAACGALMATVSAGGRAGGLPAGKGGGVVRLCSAVQCQPCECHRLLICALCSLHYGCCRNLLPAQVCSSGFG